MSNREQSEIDRHGVIVLTENKSVSSAKMSLNNRKTVEYIHKRILNMTEVSVHHSHSIVKSPE